MKKLSKKLNFYKNCTKIKIKQIIETIFKTFINNFFFLGFLLINITSVFAIPKFKKKEINKIK